MNILLIGCSTSYVLTPENDDYFHRKINSLGKSSDGVIEFDNGKEMKTQWLHVKKDSVYFYSPDSNKLVIQVVDSVTSIELRDLTRALLDGFFMGIPATVLANIFAASASENYSIYQFMFVTPISFAVAIASNMILGGKKKFVFNK